MINKFGIYHWTLTSVVSGLNPSQETCRDCLPYQLKIYKILSFLMFEEDSRYGNYLSLSIEYKRPKAKEKGPKDVMLK